MKKGRLMEIIKEVNMKNEVSDDIGISDTTIRQRVMRGSIFSQGIGGHQSPLLPLELLFVATIIQMARIRQSLSPSQGLALVNSMLDGTLEQKSLLTFKK